MKRILGLSAIIAVSSACSGNPIHNAYHQLKEPIQKIKIRLLESKSTDPENNIASKNHLNLESILKPSERNFLDNKKDQKKKIDEKLSKEREILRKAGSERFEKAKCNKKREINESSGNSSNKNSLLELGKFFKKDAKSN